MDQNAKENLTRVSDGKLYELHDMVKVGCHDCAGCSLCCQDMGNSITLDPYDAFRLTRGLQQTFEQLLTGPVELHVEDGLILPNLKMKAISAPVGNAHAPAATTACTSTRFVRSNISSSRYLGGSREKSCSMILENSSAQ